MLALVVILFIYFAFVRSQRTTAMAGLQFKTEQAFQDWLGKQSGVTVVDESGNQSSTVENQTARTAKETSRSKVYVVTQTGSQRTTRVTLAKGLYRLYLVVVFSLVALVGTILAFL